MAERTDYIKWRGNFLTAIRLWQKLRYSVEFESQTQQVIRGER